MGMELGIIIFIQCARAHRATCMQFLMAASSATASTVSTVEPDRTVLCLTMWRLHLCCNIINGDCVSVLLHVFVCKLDIILRIIQGTKLWE